jgi:Kdo2-lipid IVA lauroyltransferase/acyltransferase
MIFATTRLVLILIFRFIGNVVYLFSKKRNAIVLKNLNICFPAKNKKELIKIARNSFVLLGHSFADFILLRFYKKRYLDKHFKINNYGGFRKTLNKGKGLILYAAHFGSFELAAHFLALNGHKCLILYNPIKGSLFFEKVVKNNRENSGNKLIPKVNSLLTVYRHLKKGGIVIFAADQNAYPPDGKKIPLFGKDVWTHTGLVSLSLKTGAPVIPAFIYTKNLFNYEIDIFSPLLPEQYFNFADSEYEMTKKINLDLEVAIKKSPEHWMWQHRRFKGIIDY